VAGQAARIRLAGDNGCLTHSGYPRKKGKQGRVWSMIIGQPGCGSVREPMPPAWRKLRSRGAFAVRYRAKLRESARCVTLVSCSANSLH